MAALVHTFPQQTSTFTMLQTRPTSASAMMPGQPQSGPQYSSQPRHNMHGSTTAYRGTVAPIQPYAFTSTPRLNPGSQAQQHFRNARTASVPVVPMAQGLDSRHAPGRRYPASVSMTNLPSTASIGLQAGLSWDDSSLPASGSRRSYGMARPLSTCVIGTTFATSIQPATPAVAPVRISPERYRRTAQRAADPSHAGNQQGAGLAGLQGSLVNRSASLVGGLPETSIDDMSLSRGPSQEDAKRYRRRSMPAVDSADIPSPSTPLAKSDVLVSAKEDVSTRTATLQIPGEKSKAHSRSASTDSRLSNRSAGSGSRSSSSNRSNNALTSAGNANCPPCPQTEQTVSNQDGSRSVNIPPRSSSSDAVPRRANNPSPLSKPMTIAADGEGSRPATTIRASSPAAKTTASRPQSPAVKHLAAINEKGSKMKSKTSRLRRALSFGSAAEFRKAMNEGDGMDNGHHRLHKDPSPEELYDVEQARIAQQQEAAGIGNNIYAGGKFFAGSTDNVSISSTASSASIMIRKMGRGMKKGGRSLVGLFRPKSIIGAPAADAKIPEASQAAVSMITVEAERERVNVNADPHAQAGGGTGFPRLERNSMDASKLPPAGVERLDSLNDDNASPRKSIVGGERERAEVLAAVRRGILKHSAGSASSSPRAEGRTPAYELPQVPRVSESPVSSAPSTPGDETQAHERTGSVAVGSEDYFMSALRLRQDSRSAPGTPQAITRRNATFNPRIMFHETWPSQEYDRRGDIATCNRLTPLLAQQIKEELNSFKMEMEVHEHSKIYTHFF